MRLLSKSLLAAAIAAVPSSALATIFTTDINLTGYVANGGFADLTNTRSNNPLLPSAWVTNAEWLNLEFDALNGSFRSEFVLSLNNTTETAFWDHSPAITQTSPGHHGPSSGTFTNPGNRGGGAPFQVLPDGNLLVYVYDTVADPNPEEVVTAGTLRVTWSDVAPPPPPPPPGAVDTVPTGSLSGALVAGEVDWYHFFWGGGAINLNTEGSVLLPNNDTEIGLYNAATGNFVASDDDSGTNNLSLLAGTLAPGEYYLAVGGFNTTFGATGFGVTSTSVETGVYNVNGLSIPEPGSLGVLLAGGLCVVTRRRRHA